MATFITALVLCLPRVTAHPLYFSSPSETLGPSEPSFVPDPSGRGTVSLLLSCVITLTLCIWTAVHLNIIPNVTPTRYLVLKGIYLLTGLFAPEAILALAIVECVHANTLRKTAKYTEAKVIVGKEAEEAERIADKVLKALEVLGDSADPIIEEAWEAARVAKDAAATAKDKAEEAENAREEALAADKKKYEEVVAKAAKEVEVEEAKAKAKAKEVGGAEKEMKNDSSVHTEPGRLDMRESAAVTKAPEPNDTSEAQPIDVNKPTTDTEDADTGAATIQGGNWARVEKKQYAALLAAELTKSAATRASLALERVQQSVTPGRPIVAGTPSWINQKLKPFLYFCRTCWEFLAPSQATREYGFGMAGSFFAVMGGYTFLPFGEDLVERPKMPALTLSPRGLAFLLRAGIITTPKLAALQGEVVDKGNANVLAKFIVCAQALWMVVNCICRKATGLPVTLIELNVAMHVVCAVVVYGFWWKKPLDAGRAITLSSSFLRPGVCALLAVIYWESCGKGSLRALKEKPKAEPPIDDNGAIMPEYEVPQNKTSLRVSGDFPKQNNLLLRTIKRAQRVDGVVMLFPGQTLVNPITGFECTCRAWDPVHLTKHDLELFEQATNELRSPEFPYLQCSDDKPYPLFPFSSNLFNPPINLPSWVQVAMVLPSVNTNVIERKMARMVAVYGPRHGIASAPSPEIRLAALVIFTLFIFYGGVHATAWNSHFPTLTERRIWRAACVITGAPGAVLAALGILCGLSSCIYWICSKLLNLWGFLHVPSAGQLIRRIWNLINIGGRMRSNPRWLNDKILFLLFPALLWVAVICLYIGARLYIVVESFISVRSLPEGAFKTVRWGDFWPHL